MAAKNRHFSLELDVATCNKSMPQKAIDRI